MLLASFLWILSYIAKNVISNRWQYRTCCFSILNRGIGVQFRFEKFIRSCIDVWQPTTIQSQFLPTHVYKCQHQFGMLLSRVLSHFQSDSIKMYVTNSTSVFSIRATPPNWLEAELQLGSKQCWIFLAVYILDMKGVITSPIPLHGYRLYETQQLDAAVPLHRFSLVMMVAVDQHWNTLQLMGLLPLQAPSSVWSSSLR